jgi:thymidylate kinase
LCLIRGGYCQIKDQNTNRYRLINGEQSPENVFKEIKEIIMKQFEEVLTCS